MKYFHSLNYNGFVYTIDMFRISTRITRKDHDEIVKFLTLHDCKFWTCRKAGKYDENFMCDKLWFGLMLEKSHDFDYDINEKYLFTLEFNPNKITEKDISIYNYFINQFSFKLKRFDLAIDIPHSINDLCFFDIFKKSYSVFYTDYESKTYYIGKGDGHIKIYNKKIESNLDYELTRFEVTKEVDFDLYHCNYVEFKFPIISFSPYLSCVNDSTYNAICYALNHGFPYRDLSRTYKAQIKKDLVGLPDLDPFIANTVLKDFIDLVKSGISNKPD